MFHLEIIKELTKLESVEIMTNNSASLIRYEIEQNVVRLLQFDVVVIQLLV